ncbi:uncharacterized protein MICPUCDRAFT_38883 [Micromonas pusilla CCMP1545]|uniref:Predicted protein n=1 Tax=Micromonas pusilla (strain CCMP1545) TaxID=564608 RepID=C1MMF5_MICPC|nr:uncharacterized protein MICPUCDRAFT_38883 [Micromonas pusilla CCMP1545]EEH59041.1 predicted protein [Micromonas pusilla CCMP1545]|eukprot:XP_003057396.1 predicted protein [Micromonas pusilla CCMP1545]
MAASFSYFFTLWKSFTTSSTAPLTRALAIATWNSSSSTSFRRNSRSSASLARSACASSARHVAGGTPFAFLSATGVAAHASARSARTSAASAGGVAAVFVVFVFVVLFFVPGPDVAAIAMISSATLAHAAFASSLGVSASSRAARLNNAAVAGPHASRRFSSASSALAAFAAPAAAAQCSGVIPAGALALALLFFPFPGPFASSSSSSSSSSASPVTPRSRSHDTTSAASMAHAACSSVYPPSTRSSIGSTPPSRVSASAMSKRRRITSASHSGVSFSLFVALAFARARSSAETVATPACRHARRSGVSSA